MIISGKIVDKIEINAAGDVFHELFGTRPHEISTMSPDKIHACDLHDGDWGKVGSIFCWSYTHALHKSGAYTHLMNEEDRENIKWLNIFNKYDLYSKSKVRIDVEKVKPYYMSLIEKYFPSKLRW